MKSGRCGMAPAAVCRYQPKQSRGAAFGSLAGRSCQGDVGSFAQEPDRASTFDKKRLFIRVQILF